MGEFRGIAERLAGRILENGTVTIGELPGIIGNAVRRDVDSFNIYPGGIPGRCQELAVIISLTYNVNASGKNQLSFRSAIELILQHVKRCPNTRSVVFVTDNWDAGAVKAWRDFLLPIQRDINLEIFLIVSGNVTEIVL